MNFAASTAAEQKSLHIREFYRRLRISCRFNALEETLTKCMHNRESETVELSLSLLLFPVIHAISGNFSVIWGLSTNFYSTSRDLGQTVFAGQSGVVKHVATLLHCALGDVEDDKFEDQYRTHAKLGKTPFVAACEGTGLGSSWLQQQTWFATKNGTRYGLLQTLGA